MSSKILDSSLFLSIYGSLTQHEWINEVTDADSYSVFVSRAQALGWSSVVADGHQQVRWGMNDAGDDWRHGSPSGRAAWFQVGVPSPPPSLLPLAEIVTCAEQTLSRFGSFTLTGIQLLAPVQAITHPTEASIAAELLTRLTWFALSPPESARVMVTMDPGADDPLDTDAILAELRLLPSGGFVVEGAAPGHQDGTFLQPPFNEEVWLGDKRRPINLDAVVPEWTMDAIGFLAVLLTIASQRAGVRTSVLITMVRR
ncbi:MAG: hypothetical protein ACRC0L_02645 [Angustibacter sp.]